MEVCMRLMAWILPLTREKSWRGPNEAGKSTALKAIFGLAPPLHTGSMLWRGKPLVPNPHRMAAMGIAFVPQGRRVFSHLTVEENLVNLLIPRQLCCAEGQ